MKTMTRSVLVAAALAAASTPLLLRAAPEVPVSTLDIPAAATAPTIDGTAHDDEWRGARRIGIEVRPDWWVDAFVLHDGAALYLLFTNVRHQGEEIYPEVLVATSGSPADAWRADDHWFHASYQDCDATGRPNDFESCAAERDGWAANNFPLPDDGVVEMRISFERLGIAPGRTEPFLIAIGTTDTRDHWAFWPEGARFETSAQWAQARLR